MSTTGLFVKPTTPHGLLATISRVASALSLPKARVSLQSNVGHINLRTQTSDIMREVPANWVELASRDFALCTHAELHSEAPDRHLLTYTCDGARANFEIRAELSVDERKKVVDAIEETHNISSAFDSLVASPAANDALTARERSVADLDAHLRKLATLLHSITETEVAARRETSAQLEALYNEKVSAFEAEREATLARIQSDAQRKTEEIAERETAFAKRVADFDSTEAKLQRRKKLTDVNDALQNLAMADKDGEAKKRRAPVMAAMVLAASLFIALASLFGVKYLETRDMHYALPFSAGVLGFTGMALYTIRWMDAWHRRQATQEMLSRRYKADMQRANWIAELMAEWSKDGQPPSDKVLDVFSRNLFLDNDASADVVHPLEQLAKRASKIELTKDKVSLETSK